MQCRIDASAARTFELIEKLKITFCTVLPIFNNNDTEAKWEQNVYISSHVTRTIVALQIIRTIVWNIKYYKIKINCEIKIP